MTWWIRGYLLFAAVQGFGIGLTGLIAPAEMQIPLRITPLNTRFVAALYVAGGIGVLLAALSRRRSDARLFVVGFGAVLVVGLDQLFGPAADLVGGGAGGGGVVRDLFLDTGPGVGVEPGRGGPVEHRDDGLGNPDGDAALGEHRRGGGQ